MSNKEKKRSETRFEVNWGSGRFIRGLNTVIRFASRHTWTGQVGLTRILFLNRKQRAFFIKLRKSWEFFFHSLFICTKEVLKYLCSSLFLFYFKIWNGIFLFSVFFYFFIIAVKALKYFRFTKFVFILTFAVVKSSLNYVSNKIHW